MPRVSRTKGYRRFYSDAGKGWIVVSNGVQDISIPIGTDGTLLQADSSSPAGVSWSSLAPEFMEYIGNWDADANDPLLQNGSSNPDSAIGNVYRVSVAGTNLGHTFEIGDFAILNNAKIWERAPGADAKVTSVNGQLGDVVLDTDDVLEGSANKYFSDSLAKDAVVVNSLAGSETDQAPSVAAVNSALGSIVIPQEIIEADDLASFPVSGETEKVYVAKDTNKLYRWDGAAYEELSPAVGGIVSFDQEIYVAKNGNDSNDGSLSNPFLTVKAAMAAITDASPTKRYCIKVAAGTFVETGDFDLKANVFVAGTDHVFVTRIQADSFRMALDFSGSADNRSGFANCTLIGTCNFDWSAVTSAAGKLYFNNCSFNSAMTLTGHNSGIAQAQIWMSTHFGNFTVSGINLLTIANRFYSSCFMNQHPILPTVWEANGGSCGAMTITTTVNNFNRRCSMFAKSFFMDNPLLVDGPVSYCDYTVSSLPITNSAVNGGQLVPMNPSSAGANTALSNLAFPTAVNQPIMPANTNSTNFGDWGKQWFWSFGYVHASTGTDLYVISYGASFGADSSGKGVYLIADGAGLQANVNGGNIGLSTASVSGTGVRGRVEISARELSMGSSKIVDLAAGTANTDAVNVGQLTTAFSDRYRADSVALGNGVSTASVTFSSALATADYTITYSLVNTVDANPKFLDVIVTAKSTTGFSVKFHQNTDSANYLLEYICIIHA